MANTVKQAVMIFNVPPTYTGNLEHNNKDHDVNHVNEFD